MKDCVAIVGMNGAGKTRFGKRLSGKTILKRIDIDTEFQKKFGDIHAYIKRHGWDAFREEEEKLVLAFLKPGYIVVLGGGAIESKKTRDALKKQATVVWLQAGLQRTEKHLSKAKKERPEFKDQPLKETAKALIDKLDPLYKEVADIVIFERTPFSKQVEFTLSKLSQDVKKSHC